jgi:tripartite-type tricarboxylate transporter receptor subunit TctC
MKGAKIQIIFALLVTVLFGISAVATAEYPSKPITYVITFKVGGAADISGRTFAKNAEKILGGKFVPINKTGAGGSIGFDFVKTADPDGYTVGWLSGSILTTTNMGNLPYDYREWEFVCNCIMEATAIVVKADAPWKDFPAFIKYAANNPGKVRVGSAGTGSFTNLTAYALQEAANVEFTHVPVGVRRVPSLLSGEVEAISVHPPEVLSLVKAGKVKILAISFPERMEALPDVPTFGEFGYDVGFYQFRGIHLPKGTPQNIVTKLDGAFAKASEHQDVHDLAKRKGFIVKYIGKAEYDNFIVESNKKIKRIVDKFDLRNLKK